ncbi:hypothetical protein [Streptomyces griseofuscus]|uniref:hypothetical protein n=1 Tax=Streptomyces griseofuscus TaxID=146922 RepID=UPI003720B2E3
MPTADSTACTAPMSSMTTGQSVAERIPGITSGVRKAPANTMVFSSPRAVLECSLPAMIAI